MLLVNRISPVAAMECQHVPTVHLLPRLLRLGRFSVGPIHHPAGRLVLPTGRLLRRECNEVLLADRIEMEAPLPIRELGKDIKIRLGRLSMVLEQYSFVLTLARRRILVAGLVANLLILLFPPFFRGAIDGVLMGTEFYPIWAPRTGGAAIHAFAWFVEWILVMTIVGLSWVLASGTSPTRQEEP